MARPPRALFLAVLTLTLVRCAPDFSAPPTGDRFVIGYPPNIVGDLPTDTFGGLYTATVQVTDPRGAVRPGVEVVWDALAFPSPVNPTRSTTDQLGMARATWRFRPYRGKQYLRAYLPGARGNPVEYRLLVVPPSGKGGGGGTGLRAAAATE